MSKHAEMTIRTRQNLIEAFWNLISQSSLNKITVSSITKEAGYNRGTFYEYFKDIPDLLEQIENEMIEELTKQVHEKFNHRLPFDLQILSRECAIILGRFDDKLFLLLNENGDPSFSARFKEKFMHEIMNFFDFGENDRYKDYIIAYCYSALIGIRLHWCKSGKEISFEEIVYITQTLITSGVFGLTDKKNTMIS